MVQLFIYVIIEEVQSKVHRANCLKQALASYTDVGKYVQHCHSYFHFCCFLGVAVPFRCGDGKELWAPKP